MAPEASAATVCPAPGARARDYSTTWGTRYKNETRGPELNCARVERAREERARSKRRELRRGWSPPTPRARLPGFAPVLAVQARPPRRFAGRLRRRSRRPCKGPCRRDRRSVLFALGSTPKHGWNRDGCT